MANIQDLKRRIRSVKNTKQLTAAMKMVAAAKLRRAQERMQMARPYSARLLQMLRSIAARAEAESHPLLEGHGNTNIEVVLVTGRQGAVRRLQRRHHPRRRRLHRWIGPAAS